jgi:outer membrane biosynthesis protein TonB
MDVKKGPVNSYSLKWSCALHGILLLVCVVVPLLPAFRPKEVEVPLDFTVVLEENLVEPNVQPEPQPNTKMPAPAPEPEPEPEPDAPPPVPLPDPPKDAVVIEKKKEPEKKPPEKKPPEKKKEPEKKKPPEKKPDKPPEKKPFVKGPRVEAPAKPKPPSFADLYKPYDPSKPVSKKPLTDKAMSRADIEKALQAGAKAGTRNQIPEDEV